MAVEVRVGRYSRRQFQALERSHRQREKYVEASGEKRGDEGGWGAEEERQSEDDDDESLSLEDEAVVVAEASLLVGKTRLKRAGIGSGVRGAVQGKQEREGGARDREEGGC